VTGDIGYLVVSFDGDREKEETALEALKKEGVEILRLTNAQRGGLVS